MEVSDSLAVVARAAAAGDREALERVCAELQGPVYRLALRMFSQPADAADATQEAMVRIVTNLGSFEGRSKLTTWAHTVAARHFLRMRQRRVETTVADAETFGRWIDTHRAEPSAESAAGVEFDELCGEVRIGCTYGMLLCLGRDLRLVYLLGDVVGFTDIEGAEAVGITREAFRQRLSRARATMRTLMAHRCGLVRSENPCRCSQLVEASRAAGIIDDSRPFSRHPGVTGPIPIDTVQRAAAELDVVVAIGEVYRSDPQWSAPPVVAERLRAALPTLLDT